MTLDQTRKFWRCAAGFPVDKERVYPEHVAASGFDEIEKMVEGWPGIKRVAVVLEYGCGAGSDAASLNRRGHVVTYCDVVPENVMEANRNVPVDSAPHQGVVLERTHPLPFGSGSFDHVNCHGVFHHVELQEDRDALMLEFARVLKPGGTIALMLYTEHLLAKSKAADPWEFGAFTDGPGCYARAYDEEDGRAALEAAGFEVTRATLYNNNDFRTFWGVRL